MIDQIIKQSLLSDIIPSLDKNSATAVRNNIDSIVAKSSSSITTSVDTHVNSELVNSATNLIGSNNPLNIVTSNISPDTLASTLDTSVKTTLTDSTSAELLDNIYGSIVNTLGPSASSGISVASLKERIGEQLDSISIASLEKSLEEKANSLYTSASNAVSSTIDFIGSSFDLTAVEKQFNSKISTRAQERAKRFDTANSDNNTRVGKTSKGFVDPTGSYPTDEYKGAADTNKLAKGDIKGTVVQQKNDERLTGVKGPFGTAWEQPPSAFKGEYPYNKVIQTESGHIIEIDDTPGSERFHIYHKSGTFVEIDTHGTMVARSKGSDYKIVDKNGYISIGGKANVSVTGTCNVFIGGDANIEVNGDVNLESHNDIVAKATGRFQISAGEAIDLRAPKIYVEADEELHMTAETKINVQSTAVNVKAETDMSLYSVGTANIKADGDLAIGAANINQKSEGYIRSEAAANIEQKSGAAVNIQSGAATSIKAAGNFNVDYAEGHFADGSSTSAQSATEPSNAEAADYGEGGLPSTERISVSEIEIAEISPPVVADKYAINSESPISEKSYSQHRETLIRDGIVTSANLDKVAYAKESDSSGSAGVPSIIEASTTLKSATTLPESYQLSPNFTLGMLTTKCVLTQHKLTAMPKINQSYGDIAYNLQQVALNILESTYNVYPDMVILSGFRNEDSYNSINEHTRGLAVDLQFKNASYNDYYEIATKLKDILLFDELILEYNVYSSKPYIHISFGKINSQKTMTYWNNKLYQTGLHNLA
jgi:hypothetical protein